ncbi:probable ubiquitin-like-specific protease 2A isoform X2 [Aristolochia californica]|uniref:probable ubiquitin-like-specific protease 2A isoform X2 n=1 Tax=Aristolochia californica TaxID=171875 RepID=UPI0035D98CC1
MGKVKEGKEKKRPKKKIPVIDLSSPSRVQKRMPFGTIIGETSCKAMLDNSNLCSIDDSAGCSLSSRRATREYSNTNQKKKLDTHVFQLYLEKLWIDVPEDKKKSSTYLDCLWFHLYNKKGSDKTKVLTWIEQKEIFSWNYVFVPIVCWHHWSLLILCHLGEDLKSGEPCMLLLDSLGTTNAMHLEPHIRKFLCDIYERAGRQEEIGLIQKIPLLLPKVMKQRNSDECGNFVLYFIHLFLQDDLEKFSVSEADKYFMKEIWHDYEQQETFSKKFDSIDSLDSDLFQH